MSHPNVLPLIGVTITKELAFVSPWTENVIDYLRENHEANPVKLVRCANSLHVSCLILVAVGRVCPRPTVSPRDWYRSWWPSRGEGPPSQPPPRLYHFSDASSLPITATLVSPILGTQVLSARRTIRMTTRCHRLLALGTYVTPHQNTPRTIPRRNPPQGRVTYTPWE